MSKFIEKIEFATHPGEIIEEALLNRPMTKKALSLRLGITEQHLIRLIEGRASITPSTAVRLEYVFGTPASFWLRLQSNYEEIIARFEHQKQYKEELTLVDQFLGCYKELEELGMAEKTAKKEVKYNNLLKFFGVSSLKVAFQEYPVQFRMAQTANQISTGSVMAWLRCGELIAYEKAPEITGYNRTRFIDAIKSARMLASKPISDVADQLKELCENAGVYFVFTPYFSKTYLNGAARWLTPDNPILQLSLKSGRNDAFWFSFFHEAAHILYHGKKNEYLDWEKVKGENDEEQKADGFAADILIPRSKYSEFSTSGRLTKQEIVRFSQEINVLPQIVAGRLAREKKISWIDYQKLATG